jgi:hypothetical protein
MNCLTWAAVFTPVFTTDADSALLNAGDFTAELGHARFPQR